MKKLVRETHHCEERAEKARFDNRAGLIASGISTLAVVAGCAAVHGDQNAQALSGASSIDGPNKQKQALPALRMQESKPCRQSRPSAIFHPTDDINFPEIPVAAQHAEPGDSTRIDKPTDGKTTIRCDFEPDQADALEMLHNRNFHIPGYVRNTACAIVPPSKGTFREQMILFYSEPGQDGVTLLRTPDYDKPFEWPRDNPQGTYTGVVARNYDGKGTDAVLGLRPNQACGDCLARDQNGDTIPLFRLKPGTITPLEQDVESGAVSRFARKVDRDYPGSKMMRLRICIDREGPTSAVLIEIDAEQPGMK